MRRIHPASLFLALFLLFAFGPAASCGVEDKYMFRLRDKFGYRCTDNDAGDGYVCIGNKTNYVLIPKDLAVHAKTIFYAHGDTGVCGNGASGENYLKDQMPTLRRLNAIAVLPFRKSARDVSFPLSDFMAKIDSELGDSGLTWTFAGHSWGGKFIARELADNPGVASRVDEIFLLDAGYDIKTLIIPFLKKALQTNRKIKIKAIASTTQSNTTMLMDLINAEFPGTMTMKKVGGEHCAAPKHFPEI